MGTIERSSSANQAEFKPECHIFYDTRINDMHDDLPKWCVCVAHTISCIMRLSSGHDGLLSTRLIETTLLWHRSGFMDSSERLG